MVFYKHLDNALMFILNMGQEEVHTKQVLEKTSKPFIR